MAEKDSELTAIVEQTAAVLAASGFPKMPARVLMTLMVTDSGGLTAVELAERLGVSAAAISGAVRMLQRMSYVHRVSVPGSRRDRYELYEHSWYVVTMQTNTIFPLLIELTDRAVAAVGDPDSGAAKRLAEMGRFYRFLESRLPRLLDEWERQEY